MDYRPQSPDLSSYAPRSPDLSGLHQPQSPDLSGSIPPPTFGDSQSYDRDQFGNLYSQDPNAFNYGAPPSSFPLQSQYDSQSQYHMPRPMKTEEDEDDEYLPDAGARSSRKGRQALPNLVASNGSQFPDQHSQLTAPLQGMSTQVSDPTLGVQLKTSFPVARIKRIMQADEDIGKVAQVTPHVVSRALELFMIKLISSSAEQAAQSGGGGGKQPKRILAQHVKKALVADESYDFLEHVIAKVPDAPTKAKKEAAGSDSDEGPSTAKPAKKRGRKRKESGEDF